MANIGAYPLDPGTETGLFRQELGDVNGTQISPPNGATAEYEFISDEAIAALLLAYPTSRDMAMSKAMSSMANQLIIQAQDIQVDDIKIKTVERARVMLEASIALAAAASSGLAASAFNVVPLNTTVVYERPQGTPWPSL